MRVSLLLALPLFLQATQARWLCPGIGCPRVKFDFSAVLPHSFDHHGEQRRYHVILPKSRSESLDTDESQNGVILVFHGNGGSADSFVYEQDLTQLAPAQGLALVFLDGVSDPSSSARCGARSWNAGACCDHAVETHAQDVTYVAAVIDDLATRIALDRARVFAVGESNGASMALRAACELPGQVAGVASVVGSLETHNGTACASNCQPNDDPTDYTTCDWSRDRQGCRVDDWAKALPVTFPCDLQKAQVPVLLFNGLMDTYSKVEGMVDIPPAEHSATDYYENFPPMDYVFQYFGTMYGCQGGPTVTYQQGSQKDNTVCKSFSGCTNVTLCLSSNAGHHWYGYDSDYLSICRFQGYGLWDCLSSWHSFGRQTSSIDASREILAFFNKAAPMQVTV